MIQAHKYVLVSLLTIPMLTLGSVGCQEQSGAASADSTAWTQVSTDTFNDITTAQLEQAVRARAELESMLKASLLSSIKDDGAHGAVNTCATIAPQIATQVSEQYDVEIGRTSFKLRNTLNRPPVWMDDIVDQQSSEIAYFQDSKGTLAAAYPITIAPPCMLCHGDQSTVSDQVNEAIKRHYPDDQATGYAIGDLRGWFWVEVPPKDD